MSEHPYRPLPDRAFWKRAIGDGTSLVDPVSNFNLKISRDTKIATAGSCFAQHIARHLSASGFNYFVTEPGHPILSDGIRKAHNYGLFSARYGNIYTARQLLQLFHRAYGEFEPAEDAWIEADGAVLDPFRPTTQPGGYVSEAEMRADRRQHLAAVRHMFEQLDIFVFTLGLTECWVSAADGAAFPLCPGTAGGQFDPEKHVFVNQPYEDVISDFSTFSERLRAVNPAAQIILTVSPVPLAATAEPGAHVLTATTYSKSVLRAAAETLRKRHDFIHYFPSYEIITGNFSRGRYYGPDLREVTEAGVSHVMHLFMKHAAGEAGTAPPNERQGDDFLAKGTALAEAICDEEMLAKD